MGSRNIASQRGANRLIGRKIVSVLGEEEKADPDGIHGETFFVRALVLDNGTALVIHAVELETECRATLSITSKRRKPAAHPTKEDPKP